MVILAFGLALGVAACSAPAPAPTPASASTPASVGASSSSPTPSASAAATIDTIVVRPSGLDLKADGETVSTLAYTDAATDFVSALNQAIGTDATTTFVPSTDYRVPDVTDYRWDGLLVIEDHLKKGGPGPDPSGPATLAVFVDKPEAGGTIPVTTTQGFRAGDTVASVAKSLGVDPAATAFFAEPAETGAELGASAVPGQKNAPAVLVGQSSDAKTIEIRAPYNFGDGHDI